MTLDLSNDAERRRLRDVLGTFATGVTVVTTRDEAGDPIGITVNSFTSVSLSPPLILWCLGRESAALQAYRNASHFAVNVLSEKQQALATHFASKRTDKFTDLGGVIDGIAGVPLLANCIGQLQCATRQAHDGGDHVILLGEVLAMKESAGKPLLFHRGRFTAEGPSEA
ncbi:MAG: flavin reductase family protein [Pseudomonadota bacterium]